jgi:hypothetical protein
MLEPARRSGDDAEALAGLLDPLQHPSRQVTSEGELEEMAGDSPACWDGWIGPSSTRKLLTGVQERHRVPRQGLGGEPTSTWR